MVQIPQPHLVLGKEDNVPGMPVSHPALGAQGHHGGIHRLEGVDIQLLLHFGHQPVHNQAAGHGIVPGPVVVEVRQAQGVGHNIQLEFAQVGQHILGQNQGIHRRKGIWIPQAFTGHPDKPGVEVRIVGHQHPPADEIQEFWQRLRQLGGPLQHVRGDSRQLHDFGAEGQFRVHKGLEAVNLLAALQNHGTDFNNLVIF